MKKSKGGLEIDSLDAWLYGDEFVRAKRISEVLGDTPPDPKDYDGGLVGKRFQDKEIRREMEREIWEKEFLKNG